MIDPEDREVLENLTDAMNRVAELLKELLGSRWVAEVDPKPGLLLYTIRRQRDG